MENTGKDCRVKVPVLAQQFMEQTNAAARVTGQRLVAIPEVVAAMVEVGIGCGGWEKVALKLRDKKRPIGARARQKKTNSELSAGAAPEDAPKGS